MQFELNRLYRVKAVAAALDVSVATVYRAIELGKLDALKLGTGKGTLRVPGHAVNTYVSSCVRGANHPPPTEDASSAADEPVREVT